jgi:hypothetical protein
MKKTFFIWFSKSGWSAGDYCSQAARARIRQIAEFGARVLIDEQSPETIGTMSGVPSDRSEIVILQAVRAPPHMGGRRSQC